MDALLTKLQQNFDLSEKEILILQALRQKRLDAKQIAKQTEIPLGRIYEQLNDLLKNKLIQRSSKKPFFYFVEDLQMNIIEFTKHKVEEKIHAQGEVLDMMKGSEIQHVDIISNKEQFAQFHNLMIMESKKFKYICGYPSVPHILYPLDAEHYLPLRKAVSEQRPTISIFNSPATTLIQKTYLDALEKGMQLETIFEKRAFDFHVKVVKSLGKDFFNLWKKKMQEQWIRYNFRAYVLDEYIPMHIDINEKRVNISLRHLGITHGVVIMNNEIVKLYEEVFEEHLKRAKDALPMIKKLKY